VGARSWKATSGMYSRVRPRGYPRTARATGAATRSGAEWRDEKSNVACACGVGSSRRNLGGNDGNGASGGARESAAAGAHRVGGYEAATDATCSRCMAVERRARGSVRACRRRRVGRECASTAMGVATDAECDGREARTLAGARCGGRDGCARASTAGSARGRSGRRARSQNDAPAARRTTAAVVVLSSCEKTRR